LGSKENFCFGLEEVTTNSGSGGIFCEERRRRRNLFIDRKDEAKKQSVEYSYPEMSP